MLGVVIPVYHGRETLPKTLDSLVAQTTNRFIVVVVNDGDNEDYSDIVQTYSARGLQLYYLVNEWNGGPGTARQRGYDALKMCDYVLFCDADDVLFPWACKELYSAGKKQSADIVVSDFIQENTYKSDTFLKAEDTYPVWLHGKIYSRQFLDRYNIRFSDKVRWNEDGYFNLVCFLLATKVLHLSKTTYLWRDNANSITRNKQDDFERKAYIDIIKSHLYALSFVNEIKPEVITIQVLKSSFHLIYNEWAIAYHRGYPLEPLQYVFNEWVNNGINHNLLILLKKQEFEALISTDLHQAWLPQRKPLELVYYPLNFHDWLYKIFFNTNIEGMNK